MTQWRFAVPALIAVSLFATVSSRAATPLQPDTRLPEAAQNGNQAEVQALLRAHVSVDSAEGDGSTALHWAAYQNNLALAEELLDAHANVNAVTRLGSLTPLLMACESGSAPMVELLLKHGADVNQANGLGTTPLMMAAAAGNADVVKVLVDHGADVNAKEHANEETALMFAANLNRADVISILLAHSADPNAASKVFPAPKVAPLAPTGKKEPSQIAEELAEDNAAEEATASKPAEKLASVDAKPTAGSVANSPKISATTTPNAKKAGVADDARRRRGATMMGGMTPLLLAARQGNIPAVTALIAGGAKINEVSGSEHSTPLVVAIMNGHYDLAKVLVEQGADVNLANVFGVAPLWATEDVQYAPIEFSNEPLVDQEKTNYLALMKLLLAHGANPNARITETPWERIMTEDRNWLKYPGATVFFRAAQAWDVPAMKLLKDNGADPTIPTTLGTTPLMVAAGLGWAPMYSTTAVPTTMEAVQYCISLGADVNAQDKLGYTALHGAAFVGDLKVIQYLVDHGEKTDAKTKSGDTVADLANGPFEKSRPNPDAVALLVKLGSTNSNNCRSSECVVPTKEDKKPALASTAAVVSTTPAATGSEKKP
jgi:ankyrin repeat protein